MSKVPYPRALHLHQHLSVAGLLDLYIVTDREASIAAWIDDPGSCLRGGYGSHWVGQWQ